MVVNGKVVRVVTWTEQEARTHETCPIRLASTYTVAQLHQMGEQTGRSLAAAESAEQIAFGERLCHSIWTAIMLKA